ncbi:aspartate dehydrogenase [Cucumibacter marinus]|uniref:aspartate dehydrogenase n=1 Tax=Cucumibacter marinus TaxID=1121252 RepID=UPI0004293C46|nr:aspartate dehydrogenase [Cucumibacter marinus]
MTVRHLGVIGIGAIAKMLLLELAKSNDAAQPGLTVLCRPERCDTVRDWLAVNWPGRANVAVSAAELAASTPDFVVECAGQAALAEYVPDILAAGIETAIVSVGALADLHLFDAVRQAAARGGTRAVIAPGAVGGLDALSAYRLAGLDKVVYSGRKPPVAWKGSVDPDAVDLDALTAPQVIFEGDARQAALNFPKNANVAATIALAGNGFEKTAVKLIADPGIELNIHEIEAFSAIGRLRFSIEGRSLPGQPRTSATTAFSALREILNRSSHISI